MILRADKYTPALVICTLTFLSFPSHIVSSHRIRRNNSIKAWTGLGCNVPEAKRWESARWRRWIWTCCSSSLEEDRETAPSGGALRKQDSSSPRETGSRYRGNPESLREKGEKAGTLAAAARRGDTSGSDGEGG